MSQRAHKTPQRSLSLESIGPEQKIVLSHCRLSDLEPNVNLRGVSSTDDPNTVVFQIGTKKDEPNKLIYASFNEATNYQSFKKYLYAHLIPTFGRTIGRGFSFIYKGPSDYLVLEKQQNAVIDADKGKEVVEDLKSRKRAREDEDGLLSSSKDKGVSEQDENVDPPVVKRQKLLDHCYS
jgi:hypothetical protein